MKTLEDLRIGDIYCLDSRRQWAVVTRFEKRVSITGAEDEFMFIREVNFDCSIGDEYLVASRGEKGNAKKINVFETTTMNEILKRYLELN